MCTVEVPTCRPICIAEVLRKAMRVRNHLNRHNNNINEQNISFARRALFADAPVDHERTAAFLARENERIRRDVSARWNFDFETETPLVGRYQWTPVQAPLVERYLRTPVQAPLVGRYLRTPVHENPTLSTSSPASSEEPIPELISVEDASTSSHKESTSPRRVVRQKRVTDYMPQRKRSASSMQRESSPEHKILRRMDTSTSTDTTKA